MEFEGGDLAVCVTCGTQYDAPLSSPPKSCRICDDPRQYVPPSGQSWTSLNAAQPTMKNNFTPDNKDPRITYITTSLKSPSTIKHDPLRPSFLPDKPLGIGERAIFIQTPQGNILWDLIAFLDEETAAWINEKGGLKAIMISHPHFYTTHLEWARVFKCPVYTAKADEEWLNRSDKQGARKLFANGPNGGTEIEEVKGSGAMVVRTGGHFEGSSVLVWEGKCFHADTFMVVASAHYQKDRLPGTSSYSFMWSYPNMIPLAPDKIYGIWKALEPFEFTETYGGFTGQNNGRPDLKKQLLESMKIFVRISGHDQAAILQESM